MDQLQNEALHPLNDEGVESIEKTKSDTFEKEKTADRNEYASDIDQKQSDQSKPEKTEHERNNVTTQYDIEIDDEPQSSMIETNLPSVIADLTLSTSTDAHRQVDDPIQLSSDNSHRIIDDAMPAWLERASEQLEQKRDLTMQLDSIMMHVRSIEQIVTSLRTSSKPNQNGKKKPIQRLEENARFRRNRK
jgi:hypothetical protein